MTPGVLVGKFRISKKLQSLMTKLSLNDGEGTLAGLALLPCYTY